MNKPENCEIEDCPFLAHYALFKTMPSGKKQWLQVCRQHEREIGDENMRQAGGRYSREKQ